MDLFRDKIRFSINVRVDKNGNKITTQWPSNWAKLEKPCINKSHNFIVVLTWKINNLTVVDFDEKGLEYVYRFNGYLYRIFNQRFRYAYFEYDVELSSKIRIHNLEINILSNGKCCITTNNNNGKSIEKIPNELKNSHCVILLRF